MTEDTKAEENKTEVTETEAPKKRITSEVKVRIHYLKCNGLNSAAIAKTVGHSEAAVTACLKVGK